MTGETLRLASGADGVSLEAWRLAPGDARRGGLVVLHELAVATAHLSSFALGFADDGYEVLVPALADRIAPPLLQPGGEAADWRRTLGDIQAAIDALPPPVFLIGLGWGGTAAWMAAARCAGVSAASCFCTGVAARSEETPRCPTILHIGRRDPLIPPEDLETAAARHPELPIWLYDAGHGFMGAEGYVEDAARLARLRTLQLFHRATARGEAGG